MNHSRNTPLAAALADRRVVMAGAVVAILAGVVVWQWAQRPPVVAVSLAPERRPAPPSPVMGVGTGKTMLETTPPASAVPPVERFDLSQLGAPTEGARRLVQGLWDRDGVAGAMTVEEVALWKENWERLLKSGAEAVPALAEYLRGDHDTFFTVEDSAHLGFRSAREAAIEALARLGGEASLAVMSDSLGMTAAPREVALLASRLEAVAPGQYRDEAMAAVRESLEMAAEKQLGGLDVAPLFEVLQKYGGPEAAGELERAAGRWGQYATLALAELPDGAGVSALLRMADSAPGSKPQVARLQALQVVAQLAGTMNDARAELVDQARSNRIPPYLWPYLARPLAGEQARLQNTVLDARSPVGDDTRTSTVHIAGTNQNLVWARVEQGMTAEQFDRQANLIAELRAATISPDGRRVLDQARALLEKQKADPPGL